MCSIAGLFDTTGRSVDSEILSVMNAAQAHRGPDGATVWRGGAIGFAHTRLAIVGVNNGTQPSFNKDGSVVALLNGEIYNHHALREFLGTKGYTFRAESDTEVIPHLYREFGPKFVERLDGDFAIAVWDSAKQTLLLARDRVGVKPLFFTEDAGRWGFASESKALFASGLVEPEIDPNGFADSQFYGHTVAPTTFWRRVSELVPGTVLTISADGSSTSTRYFHPHSGSLDVHRLRRGKDGLGEYERALDASVARRVPDEVGWGVALSGGLDSSAIAGISAKRLGKHPLTLSLHVGDNILNETDDSRLVSASLELENDEIPITSARASALVEEAVYHFESPFWYGIVAAPFLDLAGRTREAGLKVLMSGDGSDELLAGYDFYRLLKIRKRLQKLHLSRYEPIVWKRALRWFGAPAGLDEHIKRVSSRIPEIEAEYGEIPPWIYMWTALSERLGSATVATRGKVTTLPRPLAKTDLHRQLSFEYSTRLPHWVLAISDRLGMARGIEVRVPFLDRDLIDVAEQLHPSLMLRGTTEKFALKRAVKSVLPKRTVRRRKKPFMTPISSWYLWQDGKRSDLVERYLSNTRIDEYGIYDADAVDGLLDDAKRGDGSWSAVTAEWACLSILATQILVSQYIVEQKYRTTASARGATASVEVETPRDSVGG